MADTLYDILGVAPTADEAEIRAAFRRRIFEVHPDRNPSPTAAEKARAVTAAYEVLSDAARRADYDRSLRRPRTVPPSRPPPANPWWRPRPRDEDFFDEEPSVRPRRPSSSTGSRRTDASDRIGPLPTGVFLRPPYSRVRGELHVSWPVIPSRLPESGQVPIWTPLGPQRIEIPPGSSRLRLRRAGSPLADEDLIVSLIRPDDAEARAAIQWISAEPWRSVLREGLLGGVGEYLQRWFGLAMLFMVEQTQSAESESESESHDSSGPFSGGARQRAPRPQSKLLCGQPTRDGTPCRRRAVNGGPCPLHARRRRRSS